MNFLFLINFLINIFFLHVSSIPIKRIWLVSKFCVLSGYIHFYIAYHKIKQCKHRKNTACMKNRNPLNLIDSPEDFFFLIEFERVN